LGDESIGIAVFEDDPELHEALNSIHLPERFTAIWHNDTNRLEIIFTADPIPASWNDIPDRRFTFNHKEK
jgi:hypothetical protein